MLKKCYSLKNIKSGFVYQNVCLTLVGRCPESLPGDKELLLVGDVEGVLSLRHLLVLLLQMRPLLLHDG